MVVIRRKIRGLIYNQVYFYDGVCLIKKVKSIFVQAKIPPQNIEYSEKYTLFVDLDKSEEEIHSLFSKECKYEIRRANKDNIIVDVFGKDRSIDGNVIKKFVDYYNKFSKQKGLNGIKNVSELKALNEINALIITCAINNDDVLVYHSYIVDDDRARLLHSCSLYRDNVSNAEKAMVGRANRLLHFEDIKVFKSLGKKAYDLGGISLKEELKNITKFKMEFGGEKVTEYNYIVESKLLKKARDLLRRIIK